MRFNHMELRVPRRPTRPLRNGPFSSTRSIRTGSHRSVPTWTHSRATLLAEGLRLPSGTLLSTSDQNRIIETVLATAP
jgi:hypothetical protein